MIPPVINPSQVKQITVNSQKILFIGNDLHMGPEPALFYFSLTAEDSLLCDPYNQLTAFLHSYPIRIFSITLPEHGPSLDPKTAIKRWSEHFLSQKDLLQPFIQHATYVITKLIEDNIIQDKRLAIAGLSRGAFIAAHIAKNIPQLKYLVGLAPLLRLDTIKEFQDVNSKLIDKYALTELSQQLIDKVVSLYIGNRDTRVGTKTAYTFIEMLTEAQYVHGQRSPKNFLTLYPSIGYLGHGTPPEIFYAAANWIKNKLLDNT